MVQRTVRSQESGVGSRLLTTDSRLVDLRCKKQLFRRKFVLAKRSSMKTVRFLVICFSLVFVLSSCKLWNNMFGAKYGCKTDGRSIGAEKLASGDPEAEKAARKAKKFKS